MRRGCDETRAQGLEKRIKERSARIGVLGVGYVGLPLAVEFARKGYSTIALDADSQKIASLKEGSSYVLDVSEEELKPLIKSGKILATTDLSQLSLLDAILICVPTTLNENNDPDISCVEDAALEISRNLRKGQLIILRSTTYPGTTDEVLLPRLESSGLVAETDFYLAFAPERLDPGNKKHKTSNTSIVVGGIGPESTYLAKLLLEQVAPEVIPLSTSRAAEMTKLLENTFRSVNIALVNEFAMLCERMKLDVWEIIEAASSKPFGYMRFAPGPGVGGDCIPTDPYFLSWKAREFDFHPDFILEASEVNEEMPHLVVKKTLTLLNHRKNHQERPYVLVLGAAYKKDIDDVRFSPALRIIQLLEDTGMRVDYHDPYVSQLEVGKLTYGSIALTEETLGAADCVIIVTDHSCFDYEWIVESSRLIVDTRNATRKVRGRPENRVKILGKGSTYESSLYQDLTHNPPTLAKSILATQKVGETLRCVH